MARIRTIKPEFFTSEDIVALTPLSRLFYVSLWLEADRAGRLEWKPRTFKFRYFPADDCDIEKMGDELVKAGLIVLYDNDQYAEIPSFAKHQVINNRESDSDIPPRVKEASVVVLAEGRKEGKEGKEGKGSRVTDAEPCPHQEIIAAYHEALPNNPVIRSWTEERKGFLRERWREAVERQSVEWWREFFAYVAKSEFLTGRTPPSNGRTVFFADLEWLVRPNNFAKVIEGKYEGSQS